MGFLLSLLVSISAFFVINQIDSAQLTGLTKQVERDSLESDSTRLSLFFLQSLRPEEKPAACKGLQTQIEQQINATYALLEVLDNAKTTVFLGDLSVVRKKYFLSNATLYLYWKQAGEVCGLSNHRVLFFYRSEEPCPECQVQGKVLDGIRASCTETKAFAFPIDEDVSFIRLLQKTFGVETVPSLVIDEKTVIHQLVSEAELKKQLNCSS